MHQTILQSTTFPQVREIINREYNGYQHMIGTVTQVIDFLNQFPHLLSWRRKVEPTLYDLVKKYMDSHCKQDIPSIPQTIPDPIVSDIMKKSYGYTDSNIGMFMVSHQHAMAAENVVGSLLESYIESELQPEGWSRCCGDFVRGIDFIKFNGREWIAIQIKNRDNTENSSSSKIRDGENIQKWFRRFSKRDADNWNNLPPAMQDYGLSEEGFINYINSVL